MPDQEIAELMRPREVAAIFRVSGPTVARWADAGKLTTVRTLGGQRRYKASEVRALLVGFDAPAVAS